MTEPQWRKSSFSGSGGCVEVKRRGDLWLVRDSKHPGGPVLTFSQREWEAFVEGAAAGEFDTRG